MATITPFNQNAQVNNGALEVTGFNPSSVNTATSTAPVTPNVVTSKPAIADLNNIQSQHQDIVNGINNQATKVANNNAQTATQKETADKQAADKQAADAEAARKQQETNAKVGALQPIPAYGSTIVDAAGRTGIAKFDPNTGKPLTPPTAIAGETATTPQQNTIPQVTNTPATAEKSGDQLKLEQAQADYQSKSQQIQDTISNIQNGTIPLTAGEQAQIDGLKQQFQQLIDQQGLTNTAASGLANTRGYQTGAAEYDPQFQVKTIGSIVTAGVQKIADLNIKMSSAVASLTQSFKDNDIKQIKDAWNMYQDASKERTNALSQTIAETTAVIKDQRDYSMNLAKFQEQVANDQFNQKLSLTKEAEAEKAAAFDRTYKMEDLALKQRANDISAGQLNVPIVNTNSNGIANKQNQDAFLATLPPGTATAIKSITSYMMNPTDLSNRPGPNGAPSQRQQMLTLAHQFDPTFDENQYAARAAYLRNIASGPLSQNITAANKSIQHLTAFADSVTKIGNSGISSTLNALGNKVESPFSTKLQTNLSQAATEAAGVKDELGKFFKGAGTLDVKSAEDWGNQLNINATPGQLKGTVQGAIILMAGQLDTLTQQYINTIGHPPTASLLQPEAIQKLSSLKNKGYTVDIPGVLYTDASSYVKNDPNGANNLKQVISAYPNLSQADALQLAQSLNQ